MANVLIRVRSIQESLPPVQGRLAEYLLANGKDLAFRSLHDLARAARASVATVSRFARLLGCSNYLRSPLYRASKLFLCTSFPESRVKVAALSSRVAQMSLIDALYLLVARHKRISLSKTERLDTCTEQLLRPRSK